MARIARLCAGLALAGLAIAPAAAESRLVAGRQLVLSTNMAEDVVIATDAALSGQIRLGMEAGLSCLSVVSGPAVVVGTSACGDGAGPLQIDVSPDTQVTLTATGDGDVKIGDLRAPLVAALNGSGNLVAGRAGSVVLVVRADGDARLGTVDGPVTIDNAGSGDVRIGQVHGPLVVKTTGSGDLTIGAMAADAVTIEANGSGDMLLGAGRIGTLRARVRGSGDLTVAAAVGDADVEANDSSDVRLASVSGRFEHTAQGDGSVSLGGANAMRTALSAIAGKLDDAEPEAGRAGRPGHSASLEPLLIAALLGLVTIIFWRIMRRPGGLASLRRGPVQAPGNPAVLALSDAMARLDQRLGAIESYVTTREFDLNRKFREL